MTYTLNRRAIAQPFRFSSPDPYWRKAASYAMALTALHVDAKDNYSGGDTGPRPERFMLCDMIAAAVLNIADLEIPFETKNLFGGDRPPEEGMFVLSPSYPYAARHYANIVEDMRDFSIASLADPNDVNVHAFGSLPALLAALAQNLNAITQFERRPPVNQRYEPNRIPVEFDDAGVIELRKQHGGV